MIHGTKFDITDSFGALREAICNNAGITNGVVTQFVFKEIAEITGGQTSSELGNKYGTLLGVAFFFWYILLRSNIRR